MFLLQRLLLVPLLTPLLVVLVVAALNPRPVLPLRLLIWSSPALSIGSWIGMAAAGGAGLSALASALALRSAKPQIRRSEAGQGPGESPRQNQPRQEPPPWNPISTGPVRAPGDPAPTVAVPFRVIRRGSASPEPVTPAPTAPGPARAAPVSSDPSDGGWGTPLADDW